MAHTRDIPSRLETDLFQDQSKNVIILGVDEVGRGALAGPIVAASVAVQPQEPQHEKVRDSKQCSADERARLYHWIRQHHRVRVAALSASDIDRWGISYCNQEVMRRALYRQVSLHGDVHILKTLIDGRLKFKLPNYFNAEWIVKGDTLSYAIGSASIVAKHLRDYLMKRFEKHFPEYGLGEHKGYGTAAHLASLKTAGLSPIHRRTFCQSLLHAQASLI